MEQNSHTPNHSVASQQTDNQPPTTDPSNPQRSYGPKWTDRITGQALFGVTKNLGPLPPTWRGPKGCITLYDDDEAEGGTLIVCPYKEGLPSHAEGETIPFSAVSEVDGTAWDVLMKFPVGGERIKITEPEVPGDADTMIERYLGAETAGEFDWTPCTITPTENVDDQDKDHGDEHSAL